MSNAKTQGAHHVGLTVPDIEFPPEALGATTLRHLMCRIPGNIRLELIAA